MNARAVRVRWVLAGVLRQALADAGARRVTIAAPGPDAEFLAGLAAAVVGPSGLGPGGLRVHPANKTALLLSEPPDADILLLGDLYYSQVVELVGSAGLPAPACEVARACGGADVLDRALSMYFDERFAWQSAVAELPVPTRERLRQALDATRFARGRAGLVPKLGTRTIGIDLYA